MLEVTLYSFHKKQKGVLGLKNVNQETSTRQSFHKPHSILTRAIFPLFKLETLH